LLDATDRKQIEYIDKKYSWLKHYDYV
jgi:hypothetical protein